MSVDNNIDSYLDVQQDHYSRIISMELHSSNLALDDRRLSILVTMIFLSVIGNMKSLSVIEELNKGVIFLFYYRDLYNYVFDRDSTD